MCLARWFLLPLLPPREESLIPPSERGLNVEETFVASSVKVRNRSRLNLFNDNNFQNEFLRREKTPAAMTPSPHDGAVGRVRATQLSGCPCSSPPPGRRHG